MKAANGKDFLKGGVLLIPTSLKAQSHIWTEHE